MRDHGAAIVGCFGFALQLLIAGCDSTPEVAAPAAGAGAEPREATPPTPSAPPVVDPGAAATPVADGSAIAGPHIETITGTAWRIEERALTEIALELWSGASVCEPGADGCVLTTLAPDSVLARLGLARGDRLRRLADQPLGDAAAWRTALRAAPGQGRFALELTRDGAPRIHRYRLRTLMRRRARADEVERGIDLLADSVVPIDASGARSIPRRSSCSQRRTPWIPKRPRGRWSAPAVGSSRSAAPRS